MSFFLLGAEEQRAQSDYAKQADNFWDREKYSALFNHSHGADHGDHGAAAHADAHSNARLSEVTQYVAKTEGAPAAAAHGKAHH